MKTNKLSIVALTGLSAIMLLSCKKDEVNTPTSSSEATKATISGFAYAEIDSTKAGLEFAPDGTAVLARLDNDTSYYYSGTVTGGKYSISIPVGRNPKDYILSFENFTADITKADYTKKSVSYKADNLKVISLIGSQKVTKDVTYVVSKDNNDVNRTIAINGTARYDGDLTDNNRIEDLFKDMKNNVPDGTKVYFTTTIGEYETTVSNGVYKFLLSTSATDMTGTITFDEFKATQKVSTTINNVTNTETLEKVFTVNTTVIGTTTISPNNLYKSGSINNLQTKFTAKP